MDIIWQFSTPNFQVTLECEAEQDPDLSWADEETLENLRSGFWDNLTFKVAVYYEGEEIGSSYLGNSIYENPEDFRDHRAVGRANRELAAKGDTARCGSYFTGMVSEAITEARRHFNKQRPQLRKVA